MVPNLFDAWGRAHSPDRVEGSGTLNPSRNKEGGHMPQLALNPFIYPGPVPLERFVGREEEIHSLLSRIATGQNTALVGEPNVGKSSLLKKLAECPDCHRRLGKQADRTLFVFQDCHLLPGSATPARFWEQVFSDVWEGCADEQVRSVVNWAAEKREFGGYALERVFRVVARRRWRVVLLVDEFDSLLHHEGFNTAEFFGALRSLATRSKGLALVTASRMPVAEMNRRSEGLNPYGSPFFNGFIEVHLRPFDAGGAKALLEGALAGTGVDLSSRDHGFLYAVAGHHPFLLQAAAGALYDAIVAGKKGETRYREAARTFYKQTEDHFADLWRHLDGRARTAATILCLAELQGRVANQEFDVGDIGALGRYSSELSRLTEQGLVELWEEDGWNADWKNWVFWRGDRWRVSSRRLVWWVSDQVLAREEVDWDDWLDDKRYGLLLTGEESETLRNWVAKIPKEVVSTATKMVGLLLKELYLPATF
jgi:hypothetical protein